MYMNKFRFLLVTIVIFVSVNSAYAQRAAVSTDLLKWATLSANISADVVLDTNISLNLEASYNPFNNIYNDMSAEHMMFSPELRVWLKRALYSHYIGFNVMSVIYDVEYNGKAYKGQAAAIGLGYGYSFILAKRWNLTPYIGFGYGYSQRYTEPELGADSPVEASFEPMITKLGVSFSYIIN